jgi:hypothetical protein
MLKNIIETKLDELDINEFNYLEKIFNIKIYISYFTNTGSQLILNFDKNYFSETCINIQTYEKFTYKSKISRKISLFGNITDIIYTLINNELNILVNNTKKYIFYINITNFDIPLLDKTLTFEYNKKDINSSYDTCPICLSDYKLDNKIMLPCNHYVCNKCFIELIKNKTYSCGLCRQLFI